MTEQAQRDWRELCAAVASEHDPRKFELLIEELTQALDDSEKSRPEDGLHLISP